MMQDPTEAYKTVFSLLYKFWEERLLWDGKEQAQFWYKHLEKHES